MNLGFITNECPIRDLKDYINQLPIHDRLEKFERYLEAEVQASSPILAIVLVAIVSAFAICACAYFLLKNRKELCKKRGERD